MADRPTVTTLGAGAKYDVTTLNANFTALRDEFDNVLGTNGVSGSNNTASDNHDMNSNKIINLTDPTGNQDAATKKYGDDNWGGAVTIATEAAAAAALVSETNAATSETNAATSETNAATSETNAATSETNAATSATAAANSAKTVFMIAVTGEAQVLTTGTAKVTFRMPFALTLTAVRASLTTTSSSGIPTFDINETGSTILSTKLTIDASETTSTTADAAVVISDTALADDAEMTIDIDTAGTGAAGAKIYLIGDPA